jgi:hypothetical protein
MAAALMKLRLPALALLALVALPVAPASGVRAASPPKAPAAEQTHPHLRPHAGGRHASFVLTLTAADDLGVHGVLQTDYAINASNAAGGCHSTFAAKLDAGRKGQQLTLTLAPQPAEWCRGRYRGVVLLERNPYCPTPSPGQPPQACPEFASQALDAGRFAFTIR